MMTVPCRFETPAWMAEPAEAWRSEVTLEIWVDAGHEPTIVYLAGTLTDETGANVAAVVRGLVEEGRRHVAVDVGHLSLKDGGFDILCGIQDAARRAGGSVVWSFVQWTWASPTRTRDLENGRAEQRAIDRGGGGRLRSSPAGPQGGG